jgi:hypothetical protein
MNLRRAWFIAACMFAVSAGPAAAQFPPAPGLPSGAPPGGFPPQAGFPQPGGFPQQQAKPQEPPPCVKEFFRLRDDTQKKADAIRTAGERKVPPAEVCPLFNAFSSAEDKMIKYAAANATWCGIPAEVLDNLKKSHVQTVTIRTRVCQAAAAPPRPAAPSLSDALTGPVPDSSNIRTGRGTFDTLTGTPLGRQ